jgi:hypothetical protein
MQRLVGHGDTIVRHTTRAAEPGEIAGFRVKKVVGLYGWPMADQIGR